MKKLCLSILSGLFFCSLSFAVPKYWVGPVNGNWNNSANWSLTANGTGSAGVPGTTDSVIFAGSPVVNIDISPTIMALTIGQTGVTSKTIFYTSQNVVLTILKNFFVPQNSSLTDSTAASVAFNVVFSGANASNALVYGSWIFSGNTVLANPLTQGAFFTVEPGAAVSVGNSNPIDAELFFRSNSGMVSSSPATLSFSRNASCIFDNVSRVYVPNASWASSLTQYQGTVNYYAAADLIINGNVSSIVHLASTPAYGNVTFNLSTLAQDLNVDFPNGTLVGGDLHINNSNNKTVVLMANTAPSTTLLVKYAESNLSGGDFTMGGAKVAVSKPPAGSPAIDFVFTVYGTVKQNGGNLSLQDNDVTDGSVFMDLKGSINQTGGTFFTNSAAIGSINKFVVNLSGPLYFKGPGGLQNFGQALTLSSAAIESPQHQVTLRLAQQLRLGETFTASGETGIVMNSPLSVGKMQFIKGVIHPTAINTLAITNPSADAIPGSADSSYVDGLLTRSTNSTGEYLMPVGAPPVSTGSVFSVYNLVHYPAPFYVIPSNTTASVYSGRYIRANYSDSLNYTVPLQGISKGKYWDVSKVSGSDAAVRLVLREAIPGTAFDKALVVAHYEGASWVAVNGSALTPGNTASGSVTSKVLSSFSPFTFGIISATDIPLAISFTGFTARKTGQSATLDWSVESSPAKFEIMRSGNGTTFSNIGTMGALASRKTYQYVDDKILSGTNYYRIKSVEADGSTGLSVVNAVVNGSEGLAITYLAPNQVIHTAKLFINTAKAGKFSLVITDMSGRNWQRMSFDVTGGSFEKTLNLSELPSGVYQLTGMMNQLQTAPLRFVKK